MPHMPALINPERISVTELEARVDALEASPGGVMDSNSISGAGTAQSPYKVIGIRRGGASPDYANMIDDETQNNTRIIMFMRNRQVNSATYQESMVMQLNNESTLTTAVESKQARALELVCDVTRSAGANAIIAYGLVVNAGVNNSIAGDEIYCIRSVTGQMRIDDGTLLGVSGAKGVTIGSDGSVASAGNMQVNANLTVKSDKTVTLGSNVAPFTVPGAAGTNPSLAIGWTAGSISTQLATKNTVAANADCGIEVHIDSTVNATARGGVVIYRSAGGSSEIGGVTTPGGNNVYASGTAADDTVLWSYDPGSAGRSVCIATGSTPTVRIEVETGGLTNILAGLKVTGSLGFYGTTPIAQQTGVAVSAAGIHAALVALGLITA